MWRRFGHSCSNIEPSYPGEKMQKVRMVLARKVGDACESSVPPDRGSICQRLRYSRKLSLDWNAQRGTHHPGRGGRVMIACDECKYREIIGQNKFCRWYGAYIGWHGCENGKRKPFTNADRIRSMSDEELAALCENGCPPRRGCPDLTKEDVDKSYHELCQKCWLDWLRQEVSDGLR